MPEIINATPKDICKSIIRYTLKLALPLAVPTTITNKLSNMIFNICEKHVVSPKTFFEKLSYENQNLISRYASYLKQLFQRLGQTGVTIANFLEVRIMNNNVADAWTLFFDNFKVKTA